MKKVILLGFLMLSGSIMITGSVVAMEIASYSSNVSSRLLLAGIILFIISIIGLAFVKDSD